MYVVRTRLTNPDRWEESEPTSDKAKATQLCVTAVKLILQGKASNVQMWRDGKITSQTIK